MYFSISIYIYRVHKCIQTKEVMSIVLCVSVQAEAVQAEAIPVEAVQAEAVLP